LVRVYFFSSLFIICSGIGVSAFLDTTARGILQRSVKLQRFEEGEISGTIVRRQQTRRKIQIDEDEDDNDEDEEYVEEKSLKRSRSILDAPKDTHEKFAEVLRNGITDAKAKYPDKIIVVVVDGGGPHTVEPSTTLRASAMSSKEMRDELIRINELGEKEKCTANDLKRRYLDSNILLNQWTVAELVSLELGAVLMFLPLNHPALNPIEQVWRGLKQAYRGCELEKNVKNMETVVQSAMLQKGDYSFVNSKQAIERRLTRTRTIRRHLIAHPTSKSIPSENAVQKKGFVVSGGPKMSSIPFYFKKPFQGKSLLSMQLHSHHLNQARLKQQRRGKVSYSFSSF
jgi:transposase